MDRDGERLERRPALVRAWDAMTASQGCPPAPHEGERKPVLWSRPTPRSRRILPRPPPRCLPKRSENRCRQDALDEDARSNFMNYSPKLGQLQMFMSARNGKQIVVYSHNGISLRNRKKQTTDESRRQLASKGIRTVKHWIVLSYGIRAQVELTRGERAGGQGSIGLWEEGATRKENRRTYPGCGIIFYPVHGSKLIKPNT